MSSDCLDDFQDLSGWTVITSGEARLSISPEQGRTGASMRLDFDFQGGGGFVVARKAFALTLPESYAFGLGLRGHGPSNILEFKLVDGSNQNVWRWRAETFDLPQDWQTLRIKSSQIPFAWGPLGGGPPQDIAAIELVVAAGPGGAGTVWIEDLRLEDTSYYLTPVVEASSALSGCGACHVLDPSPETRWRSVPGEGAQRLVMDFQQERELGGLTIRWDSERRPRAVEVRISEDGSDWQTRLAADGGVSDETAVYLPEGACRFIALELRPERPEEGVGIVRVAVEPCDFSRSINDFFTAIAKRSQAGLFPKYLLGRQTYWTPVGTGEDVTQALFNEEGMVEVDKGTFSIEPFLFAEGRLLTWADVALTQTLERGSLPIPSSHWRAGDLGLQVTAFATGPSGDSTLFIRYRVETGSGAQRPVRLFAAIRPFQVTPTWQHWHGFGGVSPIGALEYRDGAIWVDGRKPVVPLTEPSGFGAVTFAQGAITEHIRSGGLPDQARVTDPFGYASGALAFDLELPPRGTAEVYLAIPFGNHEGVTNGEGGGHRARGGSPLHQAKRGIARLPPHPNPSPRWGEGLLLPLRQSGRADARRAIRQAPPEVVPSGPDSGSELAEPPSAFRPPEEFKRAVTAWEQRLSAFELQLPPPASAVVETLKTAAAHILINRDGPALQPGPRRYSRSWIRDGALMGAALARVGIPEAGRDFIRWYAGYQTPDGNLPDCVDREGCEWLPEFDAWGQLIFAVMDYYRFSGDRAFLTELWPAVRKSVDYLEGLRAQRLTPEYQTGKRRARYGLLPESMSHEGYMAHPVHAYWDDFWALRGLKDAAEMAGILGDGAEARRITSLRQGLQRNLHDSLDRVIQQHGLDFVPGSVEFADFDPSATSIALTVADELHHLPRPAIDQTYEKYLEGFRARARGDTHWANYSAYEIRIIGALVRLGRRQEAHELLDFFLADRRIRPWNQWPEISWRDPLGPSFIGDMPHSWIGAEYILAVRSLFVYEREADQSLVIAAGIPEAWLDGAAEVRVRDLPTHHGGLSYRLSRETAETYRLALWGDLRVPPGGLVIMPPLPRPLLEVRVDGAFGAALGSDWVRCDHCPAELWLCF